MTTTPDPSQCDPLTQPSCVATAPTTDPTPPLSIVLPGSRAVERDSGERWQLFEGESLGVMQRIPDASVAAVITDPPEVEAAPTLFAETFTADALDLDYPEPATELDDTEPAQWAGGIDPSHAAAMERELDG